MLPLSAFAIPLTLFSAGVGGGPSDHTQGLSAVPALNLVDQGVVEQDDMVIGAVQALEGETGFGRSATFLRFYEAIR